MLETNQLTKAATIIKEQMGAPAGGEFAAWLRHEFDDQNWKISDFQLITEILDLPCPLIATTNYDHLLERFDAYSRRTTVQTQPSNMVTALRQGAIFHLHGIYTEPASVILSDNDYTAVLLNPAYRSAVEALWMTKSLLFLGCSFDGITDPDFSTLFAWAATTFGPTPHRHYALVLNELANVENNRRFLLGDSHLQLVPFGEKHHELARFVSDINPSRAEARLRRAARAGELLGSPDAIDIPSYLNAVGPWIPPAKIQEFENEARTAFNHRAEQVERSRATLKLIQVVFENIYNRKKIISLYNRWGGISTYADTIHQTCIAALTAISTVPRAFFHELNKVDGVVIPDSVVRGMSQDHLKFLEMLPTATDRKRAMRGDGYGFELTGRLLRTFIIVLGLNPDAVFPLPTAPVRAELRGTFIAVGSSIGVTIVDAKSLSQVSFLQTTGRVRDLVEIEYEGAKALLILTSDRWLIWDPRRAGPPLADVSVPAEDIATRIVLDLATELGAFGIITSKPEILYFLGAKHIKTTTLTASLGSLAFVDGAVYGCVSDGEIYRLFSNGSKSLVIGRGELVRQLVKLRRHIPAISQWGVARASTKLKLWLQHAFIQPAHLYGQEILVICVRFDITKNGNTAVLLWRKGNGFIGSWLFEGRAAALTVVNDAAGPCLVATLLTHFRPDEALMLFAHPLCDDMPLIFQTIQSGLCIQEDVFCICSVGGGWWFAADDTGRTYKITADASVTPLSVPIGCGAHASILLNW